MEAIFVLLSIIIPCVAFLLWCLTPKGKQWLRTNNMI